jgi:hypothetical protein
MPSVPSRRAVLGAVGTGLTLSSVLLTGCLGRLDNESDVREPVLSYSPIESTPNDTEPVAPASIENERIRSVAMQACEEQESGAREMGTRRVDQLEQDFESLPSYPDPDDEFAPAVLIDCEDGQMIVELVYLG